MKHSLNFKEIRIENTNHCGYFCTMCPREKHTRKKGIMPLEDFTSLIHQFENYTGQIHFHGYGEPLLDPNLVEKVRLARKHHPQSTLLFFTTLGVRVKERFFKDLADAGLNRLIISCYGYNKPSYKKEHGVDTFSKVQSNLNQLFLERKTSKSPFQTVLIGPDPQKITSFISNLQLKAFIHWIEDLGISYNTKMPEHNFGSGRDYNTPANKGVCSIAWGYRKTILQITWDLKVIPCCLDFNASTIFGDLRTQTLTEIFSSAPYRTFIQSHQNNTLTSYLSCKNCERDFSPIPK